MTPGGAITPLREARMSYGTASANRVTWSASRGADSQRRLMLWAAGHRGCAGRRAAVSAAPRIRRGNAAGK